MENTRPPFRADHVGSLLRPPALRDARTKAENGEINAAALKVIEDAAIRDAVALQEKAGLHAITDGEFRRGHYLVDFMTALQGIVPTHTSYALSFRGEGGQTGVRAPPDAYLPQLVQSRPSDDQRGVQL